MQPRFSRHRQGATYRLDESDLVILGGTPEWSRDSGLRDTLIRIARNGYAERAVWVHAAAYFNAPGLKAEFHSWVHQLDGPSVARIHDALLALGRVLPATTTERDPGIRVRLLRFRVNGGLAELSVAASAEDALSREHPGRRLTLPAAALARGGHRITVARMLWMIGGVVIVVFILLRIFGGNANSPK